MYRWGTYTPLSFDGRGFQLSYSSDGITWTGFPPEMINYNAFAMEAGNSESLGGVAANNFVRLSDGPAPTNLTSAEFNSVIGLASAANFNTLSGLANGTIQFVQSGTNGAAIPSVAANPAGAVAGDIWYNSTTNTLEYNNGTSNVAVGAATRSVTSVATDTTMTGGPITSAGTLGVNVGINPGKLCKYNQAENFPRSTAQI